MKEMENCGKRRTRAKIESEMQEFLYNAGYGSSEKDKAQKVIY